VVILKDETKNSYAVLSGPAHLCQARDISAISSLVLWTRRFLLPMSAGLRCLPAQLRLLPLRAAFPVAPAWEAYLLR